MHDYEGRIDYSGDPARALDRAREILVKKKLACQQIGGSQLQFQGKVTYMEKGADPLTGVSQATITASGGVITAEAGFGNLRASIKFMALLLTVLTVPDFVILGIVFTVVVPSVPWLILSLTLAVAIPIALLCLVYVVSKRNTSTALESLLRQMAEERPVSG